MNLLQLFPKRAKEDLQRLYDCRKDWLLIRKLEKDETVEETKTLKVQEVEFEDEDEDVVVEKYLYEFKDNPGSRFYKMGFTETEAESLLK